ncbi:MAG: hypothetical protein R3251_02625 [Candidatus Spechtbacterales bacterium]|nr:hypothetical protein [Candidatus Spechtbacterales bacterium]
MSRKKKNKGGGKQSSHHWRGKSRGGGDNQDNINKNNEVLDVAYPDNQSYINAEVHSRLHQLFNNDRIREVLAKLLFCWETVNPYNEIEEENTWPNRNGFRIRMTSWRIIFDEHISQFEAIEKYLDNFVRIDEDREHAKEILAHAKNAQVISDREYDKLIKVLEKNT